MMNCSKCQKLCNFTDEKTKLCCVCKNGYMGCILCSAKITRHENAKIQSYISPESVEYDPKYIEINKYIKEKIIKVIGSFGYKQQCFSCLECHDILFYTKIDELLEHAQFCLENRDEKIYVKNMLKTT